MREKRLILHLFSSAGLLACLAVTGALAEQLPSPLNPQEAALWPKAELAHHACKVYRTNCYRCHRPGGFAADVMDYVMNRDQLVSGKKITPNDLRKSIAYQLPANGDMPPDTDLITPEPELVTKSPPARKLTGDQVLGLWVLAGAPAWETAGAGDQLECK